MVDLKRRKTGKANRAAGKRFERKVEQDLENNGWIVIRFAKQVDIEQNKLINPKPFFNFSTKSISYAGTGFPDLLIINGSGITKDGPVFFIKLIECKINGMLDKEEKAKAEWIKNNLKIPIEVASRGEKRGEIKYTVV